jgi:outer membrane protein OmpA-like peptidoglycan-associated protein
VSEDKKIPGPPPPDDYSKTTPNINLGSDAGGQNDWDKTSTNFPKQPAADDWGKTVTNIRPIDTENQDFGKTFLPGSQSSSPQSPDWGVTNANIAVSPADFGSNPEDFGGGGGYDKTTPYFRLPEAERTKYQNLPPTPTEKAEQEKKEREAKGGIPSWVWIGGGLLSMFFFALAVLAFVYFVILRDTNFEATVRLAPPGSRILVDDQQWGYTNDDGSIELTSLKPGRRTIKILHPNFECKTQEVTGVAGEKPEPITARCSPIELRADEDCLNIGLGEVDKAERCHNAALDGLAKPPTVEDLVRALNILIVNFDSNKFDVPKERFAALQKAAGFIKQLPPEIVLEIGGHTDTDGNAAANQTLSDNRAIKVKEKLVAFGVRQEALQTRGYGATKPKTDNNTERGKFINRRIEYSIVKK